jgi:hypothetical protein
MALRTVNKYLTSDEKDYRLAYLNNVIRDQYHFHDLCFTDEAWLDLSEGPTLLRGKRLWYCRRSEQSEIPRLQKSKWPNKRLGFFVSVTFHHKMDLCIFFTRKDDITIPAQPLDEQSLPPLPMSGVNAQAQLVQGFPLGADPIDEKWDFPSSHTSTMEEKVEDSDSDIDMNMNMGINMNLSDDDQAVVDSSLDELFKRRVSVVDEKDQENKAEKRMSEESEFCDSYTPTSESSLSRYEPPANYLKKLKSISLLNSTSESDDYDDYDEADDEHMRATLSFQVQEQEQDDDENLSVAESTNTQRGCVTLNPPTSNKRRMSSEKWIQFCGSALKQWHQEVGEFTLVHDNAAYFANKKVKKWTNDNFKKIIPSGRKPRNKPRVPGCYPPYSPDFNVAELVINHVKSKTLLELYDCPAKDIDDEMLKRVMHDVYDKIPQEMIKNWYKHVWDCMQSSKECDGDYSDLCVGIKKNKRKKDYGFYF